MLLRTLAQGQERLVVLQEVATERLDRTDATHAGISATLVRMDATLDRLTPALECLTEMIMRHDTTLDRLGRLLDERLPPAPNRR